jgi:hypothetical protein
MEPMNGLDLVKGALLACGLENIAKRSGAPIFRVAKIPVRTGPWGEHPGIVHGVYNYIVARDFTNKVNFDGMCPSLELARKAIKKAWGPGLQCVPFLYGSIVEIWTTPTAAHDIRCTLVPFESDPEPDPEPDQPQLASSPDQNADFHLLMAIEHMAKWMAENHGNVSYTGTIQGHLREARRLMGVKE